MMTLDSSRREASIKDRIGISIFFVFLPILFLYEILFALSFWYVTFSAEWALVAAPLALICVNTYLNMFFVFREGPNGANSAIVLPCVQTAGYKYCHNCNINAPPRSHHCPTCNVCVYRRDHHCSFVGVCVGHCNQRYFIGAVANLWALAAFCCYLNWNVLWTVAMPHFTSAQLWQFMLPHFALIFGRISLFQFVSNFVFSSMLTVLLFVTYLAVAQLFCLWRGQTRVEYLLEVKAYDIGNFWENLREALGTHWPLLFISPFFNTHIQSDGRSFKVRNQEFVGKTTKTI